MHRQTPNARTTGLITALLLLAFSATAWAASQMAIDMASFKEIVETKNGKKETKLVPAQKAAPGEVLIYVVTYTNKGDELATNVEVKDPVPKDTFYVDKSATGEGTEISFSIDGGTVFAPPTKLTKEVQLPKGKKEKRLVAANEYTNIRWVIKEVPPGKTGKLGFRVKVR